MAEGQRGSPTTFDEIAAMVDASVDMKDADLGVHFFDFLCGVVDVARLAFKEGIGYDGEDAVYVVNYVIEAGNPQHGTTVLAADALSEIEDRVAAQIKATYGQVYSHEIMFYAKLGVTEDGVPFLEDVREDPTTQTRPDDQAMSSPVDG